MPVLREKRTTAEIINLATVCSGIGAPEKALTSLGIDYNLSFFSEIDKWAIKSYSAIHNVDASLNIGDLQHFKNYNLPNDIDIVVGGTPCQDFSVLGLGKGGEENSGTRSSLIWNYLQLIEKIKPKVIIWENVVGVLNAKHYRVYKNFTLL